MTGLETALLVFFVVWVVLFVLDIIGKTRISVVFL